MYCVADVKETPVSDSTVGMKGSEESHLANIGTQINPQCRSVKGDNSSHQQRTMHRWRLAVLHLAQTPVGPTEAQESQLKTLENKRKVSCFHLTLYSFPFLFSNTIMV